MADIENSREVMQEVDRQIKAAGSSQKWAAGKRNAGSLVALVSKARNGLGVSPTLALAVGFRVVSKFERLPR